MARGAKGSVTARGAYGVANKGESVAWEDQGKVAGRSRSPGWPLRLAGLAHVLCFAGVDGLDGRGGAREGRDSSALSSLVTRQAMPPPPSITNFFRRVAGPAPVPAPGLLAGGTPFAPAPQQPEGPGASGEPPAGPATPAAPQESGWRTSTRGILAQRRIAGAPSWWTCQPEARPRAGGAYFAWSAMAPPRRGRGVAPYACRHQTCRRCAPEGGPGGQAGQAPGVPSL